MVTYRIVGKAILKSNSIKTLASWPCLVKIISPTTAFDQNGPDQDRRDMIGFAHHQSSQLIGETPMSETRRLDIDLTINLDQDGFAIVPGLASLPAVLTKHSLPEVLGSHASTADACITGTNAETMTTAQASFTDAPTMTASPPGEMRVPDDSHGHCRNVAIHMQ